MGALDGYEKDGKQRTDGIYRPVAHDYPLGVDSSRGCRSTGHDELSSKTSSAWCIELPVTVLLTRTGMVRTTQKPGFP